MKNLILLVLLILGAYVGYNVFFGEKEAKSDSEKVVEEVKDVGNAIKELVKGEKERIEEGKYDEVFEEFENAIQVMKIELEQGAKEGKEALKELKEKLKESESKLETLKELEKTEELEDEFEKLKEEISEIWKDLRSNEQ